MVHNNVPDNVFQKRLDHEHETCIGIKLLSAKKGLNTNLTHKKNIYKGMLNYFRKGMMGRKLVGLLKLLFVGMGCTKLFRSHERCLQWFVGWG